MAERRHLPVLQPPASRTPGSPRGAGGDDGGGDESAGEDEERPPWHWVGFGAVAIFAVWLPLAYVGGHVSRSVLTSRFGATTDQEEVARLVAEMSAGERARLMTMIALPGLLALALAAFAGGILVGRFGQGFAGRSAGAAGGVTALVATVLAYDGLSVRALVSALVTFVVAIGFAAWGGKVGARNRKAA